MTEVRVFLADDHAVVREGLKAMINAQFGITVVGEASDGLTACQLVAELEPDVVVMDVSMPGLTGSLATERLKKECPLIKVLALTVHEDKGYIRQLLSAGAAGYVLKRAAPEELIHAIRVVAAGGVYLDPTMAGKVVGGFVQRPFTGSSMNDGALSDRETEVARLTAARGMEKLGLKSRADLVRYAVQQGWLKEG
jgi:DNA-binding NarL/FixJ family response regulator